MITWYKICSLISSYLCMLNKKEEEINKMATIIMNISNDKKRILSYILSVGVIWLVILCLLTVTLQGKKYAFRYYILCIVKQPERIS